MESWTDRIIAFAAFAVAVVFHEVAHGLSALWMGDRTAKNAGRLSLNPVKHVDPIGSVVLPGLLLFTGSPVVFGWAKPVPVNLMAMRNPRKGMWLTAIAGPATNLVLALLGALMTRGIVYFGEGMAHEGLWAGAVVVFLKFFLFLTLVNLVLMAFNLIPIPPLDGSRVVAALLPPRQAETYLRAGQFGFILVFLLLSSGLMDDYLWPALEKLLGLLVGF